MQKIKSQKKISAMIIVIMLLQIIFPAMTIVFESMFTINVVAVETFVERRL